MQGRQHALDLIRGLAALSVANYHFLSWNYGVDIPVMGIGAVCLFFFLSALSLMMVYQPVFAQGIQWDACRDFYRNRMARVLPLLMAVALVSAAFTAATTSTSLREIVTEAVLTGSGLLSLHMPGLLSNSVGAWSLGIEILFYLLFPMLCLIASNVTVKALGIATLVLMAGRMLLIARIGPDAPWEQYASALTFAPFFAAGFLAYRLKAHTALMLPQAIKPAASFLGNASYALYLTHWIANLAANLVVSRLGLGAVAHVLIFNLSAVWLAAATYRVYERPARDRVRGSGDPIIDRDVPEKDVILAVDGQLLHDRTRG